MSLGNAILEGTAFFGCGKTFSSDSKARIELYPIYKGQKD